MEEMEEGVYQIRVLLPTEEIRDIRLIRTIDGCIRYLSCLRNHQKSNLKQPLFLSSGFCGWQFGLTYALWTEVGFIWGWLIRVLSWAIISVSQGFSASSRLVQAHSHSGRRFPRETERFQALFSPTLASHLPTSHWRREITSLSPVSEWEDTWLSVPLRTLKVTQQGGMDSRRGRICGLSCNLPLWPFQTALDQCLAHSRHTSQIKSCFLGITGP